jgi:N-acetylneuraminic acid mutarotase
MKKNRRNRTQHLLGSKLVMIALTMVTTLGLGFLAPAQAQTNASWTYTSNLNTARFDHTATLLPNGKVLVAGGANVGDKFPNLGGNSVTNTAELYDPATGTWSFTGSLNIGREGHTATLLQSGKVLVAGGCAGICGVDEAADRAELYDPATGIWSLTGNLHVPRFQHTATLLQSGQVLVIGGWSARFDVWVDAELYDPATGTWSVTARPSFPSGYGTGYTATLLQNGKVLVAGGKIEDDPPILFDPLADAQLYDPSTGTWSDTGSLQARRYFHTATLLPNGQVLVAGGETRCTFLDCREANDTAELYDPATGKWSSTANLSRRAYQTATLLPTGQVLVAGGVSSSFTSISGAEIYDAASGVWKSSASLNAARRFHTATLLADGKVLVVGGLDNSGGILPSAELYDSGIAVEPNPIDDAGVFIRQHYRDFLNREPDPDGFAFWTNDIMACGGEPQCVEVKRINDSAAFFLSIEFQETGYEVYRMYKAAYGNLPDAPVPIRLDEFLPDARQMGQGVVVNQSGWEQVLENNKQAFSVNFTERPRFLSAFPVDLTADEFVDRLNNNAGNPLSATERDQLVSDLAAGAKSRAEVLRSIVENENLIKAEFNRAFVLMQYLGYLRRNPNDAPEPGLNFDGYNFWLAKLDHFEGNFMEAEMIKAFITSAEYRQRFAQ